MNYIQMSDGGSSFAKLWKPSEPNAIDCLQIVYKIAERCNLNCSYCYYYNMGDDSALHRPARSTLEDTEKLAHWLAQGCQELGIRTVHISFHGGEPMLVRAKEFALACEAFLNIVGNVAEVRFSIQTNGTLMTDGWLEALKHYRVSVGISIDGARTDHDRYRLDHQGRSSFDETESAIKRLMSESLKYPAAQPGTISVMDWQIDYTETYRYLRELGVKTMHFLLPDRNADDTSPTLNAEVAAIGESLLNIFESWLAEDNPDINVRFIKQTLGFFQVGEPLDSGPQERKSNQILVVHSDGTVAIDDSLIPALEWYSTTPSFEIKQYSLREVFRDRIFGLLEEESGRLPDACSNCDWQLICRGGDLENRYSKTKGFNNRSVYCEAYKTLYSGICSSLLAKGYPVSEIKNRFGELENV